MCHTQICQAANMSILSGVYRQAGSYSEKKCGRTLQTNHAAAARGGLEGPATIQAVELSLDLKSSPAMDFVRMIAFCAHTYILYAYLHAE